VHILRFKFRKVIVEKKTYRLSILHTYLFHPQFISDCSSDWNRSTFCQTYRKLKVARFVAHSVEICYLQKDTLTITCRRDGKRARKKAITFHKFIKTMSTDFQNSFTGTLCSNKVITKVPTTPQMRRYTTLWNIMSASDKIYSATTRTWSVGVGSVMIISVANLWQWKH